MQWITGIHAYLKKYNTSFKPKDTDKPIPNSHLWGFVSWDHSYYQFLYHLGSSQDAEYPTKF